MLHIDQPTRTDLERLIRSRGPAHVSLFLPTTPITPDVAADRILLKNLARTAMDQLRDAGAERGDVAGIEEQLEDLHDDDGFWNVQARSLCVFATPHNLTTFRLANRPQEGVEVADRFHVKPVLRAMTTGQDAFVLALAQGSVRLIRVAADLAPAPVHLAGLPHDLGDAVGRGSLESRSPRGRIQGSEGKKVRMGQYARAVDGALRHFLTGRETPLIIAATAPMDGIFRRACTYQHLAERVIAGNPETTTDQELAAAARGVLDELQAQDVAGFAERFEQRTKQGRTTTDIAHAAKAAAYGAIADLAVDFDSSVPGRMDEEDGSILLADAPSAETYGVVDEIAGRALLAGAHVRALRRADIPGEGDLAVILRYAL